ncbi:DUF2589 domain-containing protein [Aquimarina rhabdastrellae]
MIKLKKLVEAINDAAEIANATLADSQDQVINDYFDRDEETERYTAKTVNINYPKTTTDGKVTEHIVEVPLLTVVPISSARIEELRFTTNLDIAIDNNELLVSFSNRSSENSEWDTTAKQPSAKLELIVKPQENTEGLNKLIEGYEKALRAQIPG